MSISRDSAGQPGAARGSELATGTNDAALLAFALQTLNEIATRAVAAASLCCDLVQGAGGDPDQLANQAVCAENSMLAIGHMADLVCEAAGQPSVRGAGRWFMSPRMRELLDRAQGVPQ